MMKVAIDISWPASLYAASLPAWETLEACIASRTLDR